MQRCVVVLRRWGGQFNQAASLVWFVKLATQPFMTEPFDPVALAAELIRCPSVTPARGEVFDVIDRALISLGFNVHRWVMGEPSDGPTDYMVSIRGDAGTHISFVGCLDV